MFETNDQRQEVRQRQPKQEVTDDNDQYDDTLTENSATGVCRC